MSLPPHCCRRKPFRKSIFHVSNRHGKRAFASRAATAMSGVPLRVGPIRSMSAGSNLSAAQLFAASLKRHGVVHVFGQSIPSLIHLAAPDFGIAQIGYRTENAG